MDFSFHVALRNAAAVEIGKTRFLLLAIPDEAESKLPENSKPDAREGIVGEGRLADEFDRA